MGLMNKLTFNVEKYAAKYIVLLLAKTTRIIRNNQPPGVRCIYLFWHRNLVPLMYLHRYQDIVILISSSRDGELIAGPATLFGYIPVRGSSSKISFSALKQLFTLSKSKSLAITPDGPKGPREILNGSVLHLAYTTGLPLVGVAVDINREWVFRSWDSFRIPKPFSITKVSYTKPFYVKDKEDMEIKRLTIQRLMDKITSDNRDSKIGT